MPGNAMLLLTLLLITQSQVSFSLLEWLFSENDEQSNSVLEKQVPADIVASVRVAHTPFEMKTADESFLAQSQFTQDLSPLDNCHHRVIAELTSTCGELSEEELGKVSVRLLNCQSEAEGRTVFPCTPAMTIAQCTGEMDSVTWNAYQIVSNRARSVCYATRQNQFRMQTQFTVNQLVHTARGQLEALSQLQEGHENLHELTESSFDKIQESHSRMSDSQERLLLANRNVNAYIVGNIKELTREKALIASGNREIAAMTEQLKSKLEETNKKIMDQGLNQRENHNEILEDLATIRNRAQEVWRKIDEGSKGMLQYQDEAKEHYRLTLKNLEKVNSTIHYLEQTLHNTKAEIQSRLDWLVSLVGGTGDKVALLSTIIVHALYLLFGAISSAFLQTPPFSRLLLLALVPLNAWAQIHAKKSIGFLPMTMFILLTVAANWIVNWTYYIYARHKISKQSSTELPPARNIVPSSDDVHSNHNVGENHGISTPEMQRLFNILERIYNSGVLSSPAKNNVAAVDETPKRPPAINYLPTSCQSTPLPANPHNTPSSPHVQASQSLHRISIVKRLVEDMEDIPTSTPKKHGSPAIWIPSTSNSHKHLAEDCHPLDASDTSILSKVESLDISDAATPAKQRVINSRRNSSRMSISNKSISRALCLSTTKSGMPCKLQSVEGSAFCHKHQVK